MRKVIYFLMLAMIVVACSTEPAVLNSVSAEEFARIIEQDEHIQVVDVRTEGEYAKGHLPNAININIRDTAFNNKALEFLNKEYPIAVYCRSGNRSKVAGAILMDMGYEVFELNTGVAGWTGKVEY